ncbi:class II fructose-bisphosphate aldolase [Nonomuraea recticatena]|uniref:Class II fructose-bisphosphate aldolase n=1 Tax=Nonomuraea recticatena TaxID=46178 RepID=A0ABN3TAN8_9ACTN
MPLTSTAEIVARARSRGCGAGAFNVIQLEHAEGIVEGARRVNRPVILQLSENTVRYHGSLAPLGRALLAVAEESEVPVAVHLDHATGPALIDQAMELGFGSVMFDASALPYGENLVATARVAARVHASGGYVEAELGEVGGKNGVHAPEARTDPDEAAEFVAATGVDALAVAVGSSHAMLTREAVLDVELIARLRAAVPVPLVLHGSSGVRDDGLAEAVRHGMTKINIATHLNQAFTAAARDHLIARHGSVDPRGYLGAAREAVAVQVAHLLRVLDPADEGEDG